MLKFAGSCSSTISESCYELLKPCRSKLLQFNQPHNYPLPQSSAQKTFRLHNLQPPRWFSSHAPSSEARKTPLYDYHVKHAGKMVPFANFLLPIQYGNEGIAPSHLHTRSHSSIFDVSHMLQTEIRGKDRLEFMESLCTADLKELIDNSGTLTVFTDPITGGILDDLIVTKTSMGYLYVVSNAGRRNQDMKLMMDAQKSFVEKGKQVEVRFLESEERALLAVQGPETVASLQKITDADLSQLYFMSSTMATVAGTPNCRITRCGYTGEDGVEISCPSDKSVHVLEAILNSGEVKVAGLGARDSLRLEAGLCLYGNDIDHTTTPVEASLAWLLGRRRRQAADFPGASVILKQLREGATRRRVGLTAKSGPPARAGAKLLADDIIVGSVTSGCPSPSLGLNVAMGYVKREFFKAGTKLTVQIRDKKVDVEVSKMPFVPAKYYTNKT